MSTFVAVPLRRQETRDKEQKEMYTGDSQKVSPISLASLPRRPSVWIDSTACCLSASSNVRCDQTK